MLPLYCLSLFKKRGITLVITQRIEPNRRVKQNLCKADLNTFDLLFRNISYN